jgi:hypothetical protein
MIGLAPTSVQNECLRNRARLADSGMEARSTTRPQETGDGAGRVGGSNEDHFAEPGTARGLRHGSQKVVEDLGALGGFWDRGESEDQIAERGAGLRGERGSVVR